MASIDFSPVRAAKIRQGELAELLGVSRVAVARWYQGFNVHPARVVKVTKYVEAIKRATDENQFPINEATSSVFRMEIIKRNILNQLKKG